MDKKKLIGMIVGVLMFAALIAGATFAWLTFTATFTNNVVTGTSRDFTFTYTQGTAVSDMVWTTASPARNIITSGKGYITVTATKAAKTPEASNFKIILQKDTMDIKVANLIKYAVCRSTTAADCNNSATDAIPTSASGNWVAVGSVSTSTGPQTLYDDTATFNVYSETASVTGDYYIYLWLDSSALTNSNMANAQDKQIAGYIYAEAVQGESGTVQ